ncbi:MAG TPA: hypothetical protein ENI23_08075 [bacterium]|nr:hypothetical protein [bacterium]
MTAVELELLLESQSLQSYLRRYKSVGRIQKIERIKDNISKNPALHVMVFDRVSVLIKRTAAAKIESSNLKKKASYFPGFYPEFIDNVGEYILMEYLSGENEYHLQKVRNRKYGLGKIDEEEAFGQYKPKLEHLAKVQTVTSRTKSLKKVNYASRLEKRLRENLSGYTSLPVFWVEPLVNAHEELISGTLSQAKQVEYIDAKLRNWIRCKKVDEENNEVMVPHMSVKSLLEYECSFVPEPVCKNLLSHYLSNLPIYDEEEYWRIEDYANIQFHFEKFAYSLRNIYLLLRDSPGLGEDIRIALNDNNRHMARIENSLLRLKHEKGEKRLIGPYESFLDRMREVDIRQAVEAKVNRGRTH